ncbi:endonuclease/exonuclease/phosphatase family protein [Vibrio atypicus]|uniref:endonuclease/exonuclease/phosphatase family protein n=1 Tax=Vibrio atypicus TaxID=558271 RepID=UPI00135A06CA|nr:endonuclease/exonuclease/phosphatase family protein [Vibrio atypicus]
MQNNNTLTFATANLFNFVEPPNAFYDFENIYEQEAWQGKCAWTKKHVEALDADIIGLQEVFSIEATQILFKQMGYKYFAVVDQPQVADEYIYSHPVVALASKYPIKHVEAVRPLEWISDSYQIPTPQFSRKPIYAVVNVPEIGEIACYVCHLKSQRASESSNPEQEHALVGQWVSAQQRGWEAIMLRLFMEHQYQRHPIPCVLMGDMNEPLDSSITGLLTREINQSSEKLTLQDSWSILNRNNKDACRQPTHYHFAKGNVLDYLLVSQEFQPDSPYSLADIVDYQTLNAHLINPSFEKDRYASDHAFVSMTVHFVLSELD